MTWLVGWLVGWLVVCVCEVVCMCVSGVVYVLFWMRKRHCSFFFFFWPKVVCRKDVEEGDDLFEIQYKDSLALYTSYVRSPE